MGMLNIIWIVIFLVLGAGLTFQAFTAINFFLWDNLFGIAMFVVALFGIYCMTKDTIPFVRRLSEKLEPKRQAPDAGHSGFSLGKAFAAADDGPVKSSWHAARKPRKAQDEVKPTERPVNGGTPSPRAKGQGSAQGVDPRRTPGKPTPVRTAPPAGAKPANSSDTSDAGYTEDLDKILKEVDVSPRDPVDPYFGNEDINLDELLK